MILRFRPCLIALMLACAARFACAADVPPDEPYLAIPAGMTQTLKLRKDGSYSVRLGVITRDDIALAQLRFPTFDVQYKDSRPAELAARFKAVGIPGTPTLGDALEITALPGTEELPPGNYIVVVTAIRTSGPGKPQPLTFTLAMPAPTVDVGDPVRIELIGRSPFRDRPLITRGALKLSELSGTANVSPMSLGWSIDRKPGVPTATGGLQLASVTQSMAASSARVYEVDVDDRFPPGAYTGKITVRSPQLAEPRTVAVEVLSRRSGFWLFAAATLGILVGYLLRIVIKNRQEVAEASLSASLSMQKLMVAHQRIEEAEIRRKIRAQVEALNAIQQEGKPAEITAAAAAALTALEDIESTFKKEHDELAGEILGVNKLLAKRLDLPVEVRTEFAAAATLLASVAASFARNNLTEARENLALAVRGSLLSAVRASARWRAAFAGFLQEWTSKAGPINPAAGDKLQQASKDAATQATGNLDPTDTTIADADTDIAKTHAVYNGGKRFVTKLGDAYEEFMEDARLKLEPVIDPAAPEWGDVAREVQALRKVLASGMESSLELAAASIARQIARLSTTFGALLEKAAPNNRAQIVQFVSDGAWADAIAAALPSGTRAPAAAAEAARAGTSRVEKAELEVSPESGPSAGGTEAYVLSGSENERSLLRRTRRRLETVQTGIVGVIFVAGVYLLNADTWIGTNTDILAIWVLGFGVDLSAQGVLAVIKK